MTIVSGQVTVTDSHGNSSVLPFEFTVADVGETTSDVDREITGFQPDGFTVPPGEVWEIKGLVESARNVVVEGILRMRAGATLRFVGVNESVFVGGGMDPISSDVGLWVMGDGVLDAHGTPKVAWNRTGWDPSWLPTDEVVLAPWAPGEYGASGFAAYTGGAVPQAHASVPPTEVLNLSRDVSIEGTPGGRSHIFIRSTQSQTLRHVLVRHMGPRKAGEKIVGRWALHFHHMNDASRGMLVDGVVVRDAGSHAFVAHQSHGVSFRQCIAYGVQEDAYWWDPSTFSQGEASDSFTNDVVYDRCVAALVKPGDDPNGLRLCGFNFSEGTVDLANRAIGCVAVGIQGRSHSSGFGWQEGQQGNPWVMEDCVAHNNVANGMFVWWNTPRGRLYTTDRFIAYRCGNAGIEMGAYFGAWVHRAPLLVGNARAGIVQHARSLNVSERLIYETPTVLGEGITEVAFMEGEPAFPENPPVIVCGGTVEGCSALVDESRHPTTTFEFSDAC